MEYNDQYADKELMVSQEEKERRLVICTKCERYEANMCKECECFVGLMTAYTFKSCPKGFW